MENILVNTENEMKMVITSTIATPKKQLENTLLQMIKTTMVENDTNINITNLEVFGSRVDGTYEWYSDLNVKIEYTDIYTLDGSDEVEDIDEDSLADIMNDYGFEFDEVVLNFVAVQVYEGETTQTSKDDMKKIYKKVQEGEDLVTYLEMLRMDKFILTKNDTINMIRDIVLDTMESQLEKETVLYLLEKITKDY